MWFSCAKIADDESDKSRSTMLFLRVVVCCLAEQFRGTWRLADEASGDVRGDDDGQVEGDFIYWQGPKCQQSKMLGRVERTSMYEDGKGEVEEDRRGIHRWQGIKASVRNIYYGGCGMQCHKRRAAAGIRAGNERAGGAK